MWCIHKKFLGLKSKTFTYLTEDDHTFKRAKSINENVVNDELKYENYTNVLLKAKEPIAKQNFFALIV